MTKKKLSKRELHSSCCKVLNSDPWTIEPFQICYSGVCFVEVYLCCSERRFGGKCNAKDYAVLLHDFQSTFNQLPWKRLVCGKREIRDVGLR